MEQLQVALVGALLLVIPPLTMLVIAKIKLTKAELDAKYAEAKADLDAAFAKIRVAESELGIKTTQDKNGVQHVSRDPHRPGQSSSSPPHPLSEKES